MRNHPRGRTGLFVSELCLGTMAFCGHDGLWGKIGQDQADRLVDQALDAGINVIDAADVYAGGMSQQPTGQALRNLKVPQYPGWMLERQGVFRRRQLAESGR
jgi:aryl-alcohol dehydrogenase-like predicted oxidoreductase